MGHKLLIMKNIYINTLLWGDNFSQLIHPMKKYSQQLLSYTSISFLLIFYYIFETSCDLLHPSLCEDIVYLKIFCKVAKWSFSNYLSEVLWNYCIFILFGYMFKNSGIPTYVFHALAPLHRNTSANPRRRLSAVWDRLLYQRGILRSYLLPQHYTPAWGSSCSKVTS